MGIECQWNDVARPRLSTQRQYDGVCSAVATAGQVLCQSQTDFCHPEKSHSTCLAPILGEAWQLASSTTLFVECACNVLHFRHTPIRKRLYGKQDFT